MSLDAPPSVFTPPTAAPTAQTIIGPPAAAPGTPPVTPAPAAAAPGDVVSVFSAPTASPIAQTVIGPAPASPSTPPVTPAPAAAAPVAIGGVFTPPAVATSVTIGEGNAAIIYSIKPGVGTASIEHLAPSAKATTDVTVTGSAVEVAPGTKPQMVVTGATTAGVNGIYEFRDSLVDYWVNVSNLAGTYPAKLTPNSGRWYVGKEGDAPLSTDYLAESTDVSTYPDGSAYDAPSIGTGTVTVTAAASSASQVLTALNASTAAKALLTFAAAPGSDSTAAISASGPHVLYPALAAPPVITPAAASPVTPAVITP